MKLSQRCTRPRQIYLQADQRALLRSALRIASEDGSIYGGTIPGEDEYADLSRRLDDLEYKLRD